MGTNKCTINCAKDMSTRRHEAQQEETKSKDNPEDVKQVLEPTEHLVPIMNVPIPSACSHTTGFNGMPLTSNAHSLVCTHGFVHFG